MFGIKRKLNKCIDDHYEKSRQYASFFGVFTNNKHIVFDGLSNIDIGKVGAILDIQEVSKTFRLTTAIRSLWTTVTHDFYKVSSTIIDEKVSAKLLCILPTYDCVREDMLSRYNNVVRCTMNRVVIHGDAMIKRFTFGKLHRAMLWILRMPKGLALKQKFILTKVLVEAWQIILISDQILENNSIYASLFLCDFQPVDTIVVQYLKNRGVKTVSLQHGVYGEGSIPQLQHSVADYELIYGQQSYELFVKAGIKPEKLLIMGMPQMIGRKTAKYIEHNDVKNVGVVASYNMPNIDDDRMIDTVIQFAREANWKLFLKLRIHDSKQYCEEKYGDAFEMILSTEKTGMDFAKEMDAIICCASSITIESIMVGKPVFIYDANKQIYREFGEYMFSDLNGLKHLFSKYTNEYDEYNRTMMSVRRHFCVENEEDNYRAFFDNMILDYSSKV